MSCAESWKNCFACLSPPRIVSCRILSISDRMGVTERHGLVDVTPDDAALRVIEKLNGAYLKTKRVGVKKYHRVT